MLRQRITIITVTILSALGFCLSMFAQIAAIKGEPSLGHEIGAVLTFGGLLMLVIADIVFVKSAGIAQNTNRWNSFLKATPVWSRWAFGAVVLYLVGGFVYSRTVGQGRAVWDPASGEPPSPQLILTFSRWWLLIYGGSLMTMLGAWRHYQTHESA